MCVSMSGYMQPLDVSICFLSEAQAGSALHMVYIRAMQSVGSAGSNYEPSQAGRLSPCTSVQVLNGGS